MRKAIVVVDMQNDFIDGVLGTREAQEMLPRLVAKLEKEQAAGTELVFTMDTHDADYLTTQEGKKLPVEHCIRGTVGWQITDALQSFVCMATAVIEKPAFGATTLPAALADYNAIELVGLCTDICVISNALLLKAFYPETSISVDASCCAGVTPESHANALAAMRMCQVEVRGAW
ncbi:cysteine hydrolase [Selenomonas sp. TAMA-11512]|uniref:cysteine hydrolase family protein n=1 Tax=Selenomonas sp. TAMA-11512 TaxID=3095337 RepID=UPI0030926762|nr:cysteine hydrolase [Selenomonas sp. TAMA-11512]